MLSSHPVDDISSTANPPSCRIQTNLLPRVMTCALRSDVSAHPWEQAGSVRPFAYRSDELGDRLRRVLMHVPMAQPQFRQLW